MNLLLTIEKYKDNPLRRVTKGNAFNDLIELEREILKLNSTYDILITDVLLSDNKYDSNYRLCVVTFDSEIINTMFKKFNTIPTKITHLKNYTNSYETKCYHIEYENSEKTT